MCRLSWTGRSCINRHPLIECIKILYASCLLPCASVMDKTGNAGRGQIIVRKGNNSVQLTVK